MSTHSNNRIVQSVTYFLQVLSAQASRSGFCYHCEHVTLWRSRLGFYCCMHCDHDPLEHQPDQEVT